MRYIWLIFMLVFTFSGVANANRLSPNQDEATYLKYYEDGIYDAIKQIQKEAQEGLTEYPLDKQIKGNIVVALEIGDTSVTDIVRIGTVAIKNNYTESITAKNLKNGKGYIVFDSFDRDADAEYTLRRLKEYGINAEKIYSGKWTKNPIVIRKIINDLEKGVFANMPVKVIEIERTVYKEGAPSAVISPSGGGRIPSIKDNIEANEPSSKDKFSIKQKKEDDSKQRTTVKKLQSLIDDIKEEDAFSFDDMCFTYKGKTYSEGDDIDGFKITKVYISTVSKNLEKMVVRFDNFTDYHMIKTRSIKQGNTGKESKKEDQKSSGQSQQNTKNKTVETSQSTTKIKTYLCNFSNIRSLYIPETGATIKLQESHYAYMAGKTQEVVFDTTTNSGYVLFKAGGQKPAGIKQSTWEKICKQN